jgi:hypothetical protein
MKMKTFKEILVSDNVKEFIAIHNDELWGDNINGCTGSTTSEILEHVYNATKDGCTASSVEDSEEDFWFSYNPKNPEDTLSYSTLELCELMGIEPEYED